MALSESMYRRQGSQQAMCRAISSQGGPESSPSRKGERRSKSCLQSPSPWSCTNASDGVFFPHAAPGVKDGSPLYGTQTLIH